MDLVKKLLQGDEKSAARLISLVEEGRPEGLKAISLIYPHTGKAHVIGVTGAPVSYTHLTLPTNREV